MPAFTLALALTFATPVAQDPALQQDARCTIALQALAEQADDAEAKGALNGIMLFYVGRLTMRVKPEQMEDTINEAGEGFPESGYRDFALNCINQMKTLSGADKVSS